MSGAPFHGGAHGGARSGAGRKPSDYELSQARADLDEEKAKHERSKRLRSELQYQIDLGKVVSRQAVQQASATALSVMAQSLRSLPDNLERKLGLSPAVTEQIEQTIDAVLTDLAAALAALTPPERHDHDAD
jgi:multidrug resistance efflux pump